MPWALAVPQRSERAGCREAFWLSISATLTCIQTLQTGKLPVAHCCSLGLGHAQTRRGKNSSPHLLISPGGMQRCLRSVYAHHAVSRNNLLKICFWSWGEGDAKEELMVMRVLEKEGSMEIISVSILLFPGCSHTSEMFTQKKEAPSPQQASCMILETILSCL